MLTEQLRELEADGLVERQPQGPIPSPVHYRLTAYGRTVLPLVEQVRLWGLEHQRQQRALAAFGAPSLSCREPTALGHG